MTQLSFHASEQEVQGFSHIHKLLKTSGNVSGQKCLWLDKCSLLGKQHEQQWKELNALKNIIPVTLRGTAQDLEMASLGSCPSIATNQGVT